MGTPMPLQLGTAPAGPPDAEPQTRDAAANLLYSTAMAVPVDTAAAGPSDAVPRMGVPMVDSLTTPAGTIQGMVACGPDLRLLCAGLKDSIERKRSLLSTMGIA